MSQPIPVALQLQRVGTIVLPKLYSAPAAVELRFAVADLHVGVIMPVSPWQGRQRVLLPSEARALCQPPCSLAATLVGHDSLPPDALRAVVPRSGFVRFTATVRGTDCAMITIPAAWWRGMRFAGWEERVMVVIEHGNDRYQFERSLVLKRHTVVVALPRGLCPVPVGAVVTVELRPTALRSGSALVEGFIEPSQLEQVVLQLRANGFPWEELKARTEKDVLARVVRARVICEGDTITYVHPVGQRTCQGAHPARFHASSSGSLSIVDGFNDDQVLRRAVAYQLKRGDPVTPYRIVRALSALLRGPLNFPPALARWLVDLYVPEQGTVLDPCSGFGGRLLGAVASTKHAKYIGADIEPAAVTGNCALARQLGVGDRVVQLQGAVEDLVYPPADLVLTSPPYYNRERYGAAAELALAKYPSCATWIAGFLGTLLRKAFDAAPLVVINVAPIRVGTERWDLPTEVLRLAESYVDRERVRVLTWQIAKFGRGRLREEKILVLPRKA